MFEQDVGFWEGILDVARGRGQLRLLVQPLMAIILGARLGLADAREGKAPFLLRLFVTEPHRARLARQAASDVLLPFIVAVVIDGLLQYYALGYVRPLAAITVGAVLIWLPFSLARALANRVYRRTRRRARPVSA